VDYLSPLLISVKMCASGVLKMFRWTELIYFIAICATAVHSASMTNARKKNWIDDSECPKVKPMLSFDLFQVRTRLLIIARPFAKNCSPYLLFAD